MMSSCVASVFVDNPSSSWCYLFSSFKCLYPANKTKTKMQPLLRVTVGMDSQKASSLYNKLWFFSDGFSIDNPQETKGMGKAKIFSSHIPAG